MLLPHSAVGYNKSADTPFGPVSGPQGLQEAHGLHLLVCGPSVVGAPEPNYVAHVTLHAMPNPPIYNMCFALSVQFREHA